LKLSGLVFAGLLVIGRSASYGNIQWTPTFHQADTPLVVIQTVKRSAPNPNPIPKTLPSIDSAALSKRAAASEVIAFSAGKTATDDTEADGNGSPSSVGDSHHGSKGSADNATANGNETSGTTGTAGSHAGSKGSAGDATANGNETSGTTGTAGSHAGSQGSAAGATANGNETSGTTGTAGSHAGSQGSAAGATANGNETSGTTGTAGSHAGSNGSAAGATANGNETAGTAGTA